MLSSICHTVRHAVVGCSLSYRLSRRYCCLTYGAREYITSLRHWYDGRSTDCDCVGL